MDDIKKPKRTSKRRMADVQAPGTSAPSETSRPVIVTNRPLLKDPMVVDKKDSEEDERMPQKSAETLSSSGKPDLRPLDNSITPDEAAVGSDSAQEPGTSATEQQPPADEAKTPAIPNSEPEDSVAQVPGDVANNNDSAPTPVSPEPSEVAHTQADDQSIESAPKNVMAKKAEAEAAEQAKHDAALQKLVDSKQYILSINTVEKRKNKKVVVLGVALCVVLVLTWLDIALDAGIIKLGGLDPVTHFFSN